MKQNRDRFVYFLLVIGIDCSSQFLFDRTNRTNLHSSVPPWNWKNLQEYHWPGPSESGSIRFRVHQSPGPSEWCRGPNFQEPVLQTFITACCLSRVSLKASSCRVTWPVRCNLTHLDPEVKGQPAAETISSFWYFLIYIKTSVWVEN